MLSAMSSEFLNQLNEYEQSWPEERKKVLRCGRPGHFTSSAFIMNESGTHLLLVKHRKLGIWLQPGGHADGNENLYEVAVREMQEETGVMPSTGSTKILDLDIHEIPAHGRENAHQHFDVRYLLIADAGKPLLISDESTDLAWVPISEIEKYTKEESLLRMLRKTAGTTASG